MAERIIFDYGGTLDTNGIHWAHVLWEEYRAAGVPVNEAQFRDAYVYGERSLASHPIILPTDKFLDLLFKKVHEEFAYLVQQDLLNFPSSVLRSWEASVATGCYEFVKTTLAVTSPVLRTFQNRYRPVLVTNFYGNIHSVLEDFGILPCFHAVVESAVCGVRKPNPDIFRLGVEATGAKASEVVVVGDSLSKDIMPSKSIGCKTIWLKGRGWEDKPEHPTRENMPTFIVSSIAQIPEIISKL